MTRKHPNARRAVALALFAIFVIASSTGAWFNPSTASAMTTGGSGPGRSPLPGDPNTPDEGGRSGSTNRIASTDPRSTGWIVIWLKGLSHFHFILR